MCFHNIWFKLTGILSHIRKELGNRNSETKEEEKLLAIRYSETNEEEKLLAIQYSETNEEEKLFGIRYSETPFSIKCLLRIRFFNNQYSIINIQLFQVLPHYWLQLYAHKHIYN